MLKKQKTLKLSASAVLFVCFIVVAFSRASFSNLDSGINGWAASVNQGTFAEIAIAISYAFDTLSFLAISLATATVFLVKKHWEYGLLLLGAMGGNTLLVSISKALIMSPRPSNEILPSTDFSFPSGHVTSTIVYFGVIVYFIWQHRSSLRAKTAVIAFYAGITALVGFDRVYLNMHWLSDIVGSVFLGGSWLLLCVLILDIVYSGFRVHEPRSVRSAC